jgi:hypothetical protein
MDGGHAHLSLWKPKRATNWVLPRYLPGESQIKHRPSHQPCPSISVLSSRITSSPVRFHATPPNSTTPQNHIPVPPLLSGQDSRPVRSRRRRKGATKAKTSTKKPKKPKRVIEYIQVPKHWFSDPLNHAMKTAVRPPTKLTTAGRSCRSTSGCRRIILWI